MWRALAIMTFTLAAAGALSFGAVAQQNSQGVLLHRLQSQSSQPSKTGVLLPRLMNGQPASGVCSQSQVCAPNAFGTAACQGAVQSCQMHQGSGTAQTASAPQGGQASNDVCAASRVCSPRSIGTRACDGAVRQCQLAQVMNPAPPQQVQSGAYSMAPPQQNGVVAQGPQKAVGSPNANLGAFFSTLVPTTRIQAQPANVTP